jgi:hypothetical protein
VPIIEVGGGFDLLGPGWYLPSYEGSYCILKDASREVNNGKIMLCILSTKKDHGKKTFNLEESK